jgi:hypothetical protein
MKCDLILVVKLEQQVILQLEMTFIRIYEEWVSFGFIT